MKLTPSRRQLMVGAAATLALPAYIRRANAQSSINASRIVSSPPAATSEVRRTSMQPPAAALERPRFT